MFNPPSSKPISAKGVNRVLCEPPGAKTHFGKRSRRSSGPIHRNRPVGDRSSVADPKQRV